MSDNDSTRRDDEFPRRKPVWITDWDGAVERAIREAMDRGDFDDLPGAGKPLDLRRDPNTPPEWEMAFKLLKENGFAPDWIELDKEIRTARAALFAPFDQYLERIAKRRDASDEQTEGRLVAEFRERAAALNREIDVFNLKAPSSRLHHVRIRTEEEIEKFRAAIANKKNPPSSL